METPKAIEKAKASVRAKPLNIARIGKLTHASKLTAGPATSRDE